MEKNYSKQKDIEYIRKINELLGKLPKFCDSYFTAIETTKMPRTRMAYAYDLVNYFTYLQEHNPLYKNINMHDIPIDIIKHQTAQDIREYLRWLQVYDKDNMVITNENKGLKRKLSTLRSFYKHYYNEEIIDKDPAALVQTPKLPEKEIVRLEVNEVAQLLDNVESGDKLTKSQQKYHDKTKSRDLALVTLLLGTGMRVSECVGINITDIDFDNNGVKIRRKGGNEAILFFSDEVASALMEYIEERNNMNPLSGHEDALFLSLQNKRIGVRSVENIVKKYSQSVTLKNISPHKLRSTYGSALYENTGDIYLVADVLGHKDVNTTRKHYAKMAENRRRYAADKVTLRESSTIKTHTK